MTFSIKVLNILLGLSLFSPANAITPNVKSNVNDSLNIEPSVSLSKVCKVQYEDPEYFGQCKQGYILKTEIFSDGSKEESIFMDNLEGYAWTHITLNQLKNNIVLFSSGCGTYCGGNILVGTNGKEQYFDYWFEYDPMRECALEYDNNKQLWVAKSFFTSNNHDLKQTRSTIESAFMPEYSVKFEGEALFIATSNYSDNIEYIDNPCNR